MRRTLIVLLSLAAAARCASTSDRESQVRDAMTRYATALHTATPHEIASFYAQDGQLLLPGMQPITGPKGIEDFLAPMAASVEVTSVNVTSDVVEVHGAAANQWGTYEQVAPASGARRRIRFTAVIRPNGIARRTARGESSGS